MKKSCFIFLMAVSLLCLSAAGAFAAPLVPNSAPGQKLSKYGYEEGDAPPEAWFFPRSEARWDGYGVTSWDWVSLTQEQKEMFVREGADELSRTRHVSINLENKWRILDAVDTAVGAQLEDSPNVKRQMIKVLFECLEENDCVGPEEIP